jgi:multiple sugar transport system substrate-binding protein
MFPIIKYIIVIFLVLSLSARTSNFSSEITELTVMHYSQEEKDFYKDVSDEFNREHPSIKLKVVIVPNTKYYSVLSELFEAGTSPDIFTYHSSGNWVLSMSELLENGWISAIADDPEFINHWIKRWPENSFIDGINVKEGIVFGFPYTDNNVRGLGYLFVNKRLFEFEKSSPEIKAGEEPLSRLDSFDYTNPETWESFLEACRIIKQKSGRYPLVIPNTKPSDVKSTWAALAASIMTDQFFDYQKGRFCIDDPRMQEVFNFISTLYQEDLVFPGTYSKIEAREKFARGESAFIFDGSYLPNVLKNNLGIKDVDLKVIRPPYPKEGHRGALAVRNTENKIWISSQTKHLEEARIFIDWMTQPDGYFAREYLLRGFSKVAFIDAGEYIDELDDITKQILNVAGMTRVKYPEPLVKCPDLIFSKAYNKAENIKADWEIGCIYNALYNDEDFSVMAKKIAAEKNEIFLKSLGEEKASGINVGKDCYTFPGLRFNENYVY